MHFFIFALHEISLTLKDSVDRRQTGYSNLIALKGTLLFFLLDAFSLREKCSSFLFDLLLNTHFSLRTAIVHLPLYLQFQLHFLQTMDDKVV